MYYEKVKTMQQALIHLLLHCCSKDGELHEDELYGVAEIIQSMAWENEINLDAELAIYQSYKKSIKDETSYLVFLVRIIQPVNRLSLMWLCAQLTVKDRHIALSEELLVSKIGNILHLKPADCLLLQELAFQTQKMQLQKTV
jgi:uncharacterized tellurite resistance protein B-like protein